MLSPVEIDVLRDLLIHGDNVPANIAENTGRHPKSVSKRLPDLESRGLIRNKGHGVWTLTAEGLDAAQTLHGEDAGDA
jgi:Mn-dependent DtxR family transcriptional regulator